MTRWMGACVILGLVACETESAEVISNGTSVEAAPGEVRVHAEVGVAPNPVLLRTVGVWGTSSGSDALSVDIDGSLTPVQPGPFGYAVVDAAAGVSSVGDTEIVTLDAPAGLPPLPEIASIRPTASEVVSGRKGYLAQSGSEVWWTGPSLPDHLVADLGSPIRGLRAGQYDGDGAVDALVWGGDKVLVLRGRGEGGAGFGAGVQAEGWTVLAAAMGDLDSDGDADLVIAWDIGGGTVLQTWLGDGAYTFTPADELAIIDPPIDLSISATRPDAAPVLTVLIAGAPWVRYRFIEGGLAGTGGGVQISPVAGSRLFDADLNGDDRDELIIISPRREGAPRTLEIWDLGSGDNPVTLPVDVPGGEIALADADSDGVTDLWLLDESGLLQIVRDVGGSFERADAAVLAATGPIALSQLDDGLEPDLLVATGDAWQRFAGTSDEEDGRWRPDLPIATRRNMNLTSSLVPYESGDAADEFVAIGTTGEWTNVRRLTLGSRGPSEDSDIRLRRDTVGVIDLAACGTDIWVLLADEVVHADGVTDTVVGRTPVTDGVAVDCRPGSSTAAVLTTSERIELGSGAVPGASSASSASDITFVDGDLVDCTAPCINWPTQDGEILVEATAEQTFVHLSGGVVTLEGGGALAVQDSNDDGEPELWSRDASGRIRVMHATEAGPVVEAWRWTSPRYAGAPWLGRAPDGEPAVWFHDDTDILWMP